MSFTHGGESDEVNGLKTKPELLQTMVAVVVAMETTTTKTRVHLQRLVVEGPMEPTQEVPLLKARTMPHHPRVLLLLLDTRPLLDLPLLRLTNIQAHQPSTRCREG